MDHQFHHPNNHHSHHHQPPIDPPRYFPIRPPLNMYPSPPHRHLLPPPPPPPPHHRPCLLHHRDLNFSPPHHQLPHPRHFDHPFDNPHEQLPLPPPPPPPPRAVGIDSMYRRHIESPPRFRVDSSDDDRRRIGSDFVLRDRVEDRRIVSDFEMRNFSGFEAGEMRRDRIEGFRGVDERERAELRCDRRIMTDFEREEFVRGRGEVVDRRIMDGIGGEELQFGRENFQIDDFEREELHRGRFQDRRIVEGFQRGELNSGRIDNRRIVESFEREGLNSGRIEDRRIVESFEREGLNSGRIEDRRIVESFEREGLNSSRIEDRRIVEGFERGELSSGRFDDRRLVNDVENEELRRSRSMSDFHREERHHEPYHPEMLPREFDLNSGGIDHDLRGGTGARRDHSRSPIKFRTRGGIEVVDDRPPESFDQEMNRSPFTDRKRRAKEREWEMGEVRDCDEFALRKNPSQKKSAFLRLQPAKPLSIKNRLNSNTPSPRKGKEHKGKETSVECLDRRSSEERVGSPVELDVSFKSNALVAKAVMASPLSSGVNPTEKVAASDLGFRVGSESPSRAESARNSGNDSSMSKKEEKQSDNRVRISPVMKRIGRRNKAAVRGTSSESSSSGSTCKESPNGEVLSTDDKNAGSEKLSSPNVRKKRKGVNLVSRLSSSVQTSTECAFDLNSSPCVDSMSDKSNEQLDVELSTVGNVIGSAQEVKSVDLVNIDINKSSGAVAQENDVSHSDIEVRPSKRMKKESLESLFDLSRPLEPASVQDEQRVSSLDEEVTNSVEKCSSEIDTEIVSIDGQETVPLLADNGPVEGSLEPVVVSTGVNVDTVDVSCENIDTRSSMDVTNSYTCPVGVLTKTASRTDLTSSVVDLNETYELPPETDTTGQPSRDVHIGRYDKTELRHLGDDAKLGNSLNIDLSNDDVVPIDSNKLTTVSDDLKNDTDEQQCTGIGLMRVNDEVSERIQESAQACVSSGPDVALSSVREENFPLDKKRKVGVKPESSDSLISEFLRDIAMSMSFHKEDSRLPAENQNSAVSVSGCCISESAVSHNGCLMQGCVEGLTSMDSVPDSDVVEYPPSKKRKILPPESVSSDALVSVSLGSRISANGLISIAEGPLSSVERSAQSAEGAGWSNPPHCENALNEATDSLPTPQCSFSDSLKPDFLSKDHCEYSPPNDAKSACVSESGYNKNEDRDLILMEAGNNDEIKLITESQGEMAKSDRNSVVDCIRPDHAGVCADTLQATEVECESNINIEAHLLSPSESQQLRHEPTYSRVTTNSAMVVSPSNMSSSGACSLPTPTLGTSSATLAIHTNVDSWPCVDNKKSSKSLKPQGTLTSKSSVVRGGNQMNVKPVTSATAAVQPSVLRNVPQQVKNTVSSLGATSNRSTRKNVLLRGETSLPSSRASPVTKPSNKASSTYPAKPRTWHRTDNVAASNILVRKPLVSTTPPQRPPFGKPVKTQNTSYIRKGNSLVRNPASGAASLHLRVSGAPTTHFKPNEKNKSVKPMASATIASSNLPDSLMIEGQKAPIEMPTTPPLPSSAKTSDCVVAYAGDCTPSPQVDHSEGQDEEAARPSGSALNSSSNTESVLNGNLEDTGTLSDGVLLAPSSKRIVYIKRKSNQLIAAPNPSTSSAHTMDKTATSSSENNNYYKRRKNQLVRASSESNIQQMVDATDDSSNSWSQKASNVYCGKTSTKRLSSKVKSTKASLVWKLGDPKSSRKCVEPLRYGKLLSHLLPWKRATYLRSAWQSSASFSNSASLLKPRKLLSSKKRAAIYVRSGRGFSLKRSKVISLAGSLKWSKSMEKRSKSVNEEAALAVAAKDSVERQKIGASGISSEAKSRNQYSHKSVHGVKLHPGGRIFRVGVFRYRMDPSRRTLQRIPDEEALDSKAAKPEKGSRKTYVPKRLLIGSDEYVRIGNGNQLVRDPKRRTRILASEKVRWSLHTARMRLAKRRKFCLFFTRFGKCNKGEGKCPYMHDSTKIAVCTKFLNGLCADSSCKLTHKVIPERMPDCSYFLQGLCSNESCPYRHVNVNPKASVCESFLKGYCAEGDECRKKHSYTCPQFEATGSCPQGSKCKLYHPKKGKGKERKASEDQRKSCGRYFGSGLTVDRNPETAVAEKHFVPTNDDIVSAGGDFGDYISLDASDDEVGENNDLNSEQSSLSEGDAPRSRLDDLDEFTKPLCFLDA